MLRLTPADLLGHLRCLFVFFRHKEAVKNPITDADRQAVAKLINAYFDDDEDDTHWDVLGGAPKPTADEAHDLLAEIEAYLDDTEPSEGERLEMNTLRAQFKAIHVQAGERRRDRNRMLTELYEFLERRRGTQGELWGPA